MTLICGCRGWTHDSAAQDFLRSSSTLQQLTLRQFPHKEQIELYLQLSAYDPVLSDRTLMAFLEYQVSMMKDRDWKEMASESLERIRKAGAK